MKSLAKWNREYDRIMQQTDIEDMERDQALAQLMDRIKFEFDVPLLHDPEWEQKNRPVIAMYRKVSESRITLR